MGRPATCECGECTKCKNRARMRAYRARNPEYLKRQRALENTRRDSDPESARERGRRFYRENRDKVLAWSARERLRYGDHVSARLAVKRALVRGDIVKTDACQKCGADTLLEAHHDDYSKPLVVTWLCRKCHGLVHRLEG